MSRKGDTGSLFIGRLSRNTRLKDLEDIFEAYGRMIRCDIKYGAEMAFAFVDYEDKRDAEDALRYENGRTVCGSSITVEWAKGTPRVGGGPRGGGTASNECYKCGRRGHLARDCADDRSHQRSGPPRDRYRDRSRSRDRDGRRSRSYDRRRRSRSPY